MKLAHTHSRPLRAQQQAGFTLIELMIVVAIVAILSAIALPSYRAYIQRSDRASARAALLEAQQFMERFYSVNDEYDKDKAGTNVALPARLTSVPAEAPRYTLTVATTVNSYTLTATPIMTVPTCGNLLLTHTGVKEITVPGTHTNVDIAACWK